MIITVKPFGEMTLAELHEQRTNFLALLSRTPVASARARVADVLEIIAIWIARREKEEVAA